MKKPSDDFLCEMQQTMLLTIFAHLEDCLTAEDAYKRIAQGVQELLPTTVGALYVRKEPREFRFEAVAGWGQCLQAEPAFRLQQCQALRLMEVMKNTQAAPLCQHAVLPPGGTSMCVPLMADGHASSLLYVESSSGKLTPPQEKLLLTLGRQSALVLRNLEKRQELEERATRDARTGLSNVYAMHDALEREIWHASRHQLPVGLIMLDIDHFKEFNTKFILEGGNAVLCSLADLLRKRVRGEDVACRWGGEEFLLILRGTSLKKTQQRAEKLRREVEQLKVTYEDRPLGPITISLGVAVYPKHGTTPASLLGAVAAALSQGKAGGRNRVVVASSLQPA